MRKTMHIVIAGLLMTAAALLVAAHPQDAAPASASPIFGVTLPPGYRGWQVISVAHEAGNNNDIRAILGNDVAVAAFRRGQVPLPEGTVIVRLAWRYEASAQNDAVFGQAQSFVAGDPTNVQVSVKDMARYPGTGGWGYGQFEDGKANPSRTVVTSCFACHSKLPRARDFVFTRYAR
jgi:hypothetical protein